MKCGRLILFFLVISSSLFSQDLTGIWRGSFYAGAGPFREYYKYEVQIDQMKDNALQGVTYSYRTTVFYGKATFEGIWFPKSKNVLVKELKLIELKVADHSDACAMTCDLDYSIDDDGKEVLSGTFTSVNANTKADCGGGTVYLERVQESDFQKEDFLSKKKTATPPPTTQNEIKPKATPTPAPVVNIASKANAKKLQTVLGVPADGVAGPKTLAALKKKLPDFKDTLDVSDSDQVNDLVDRIKKANATAVKKTSPANNTTTIKKTPHANSAAVKKTQPANTTVKNKTQQPPAINHDTIVQTVPKTSSAQSQVTILPQKKIVPVPDVIKTRSNPLIKTITTNSSDIKVELYDNGEIDGDTITVYDNNEVIAWKKGLTDKPITLNIKADSTNPVHEFVMVADNLGSIPPNTALMIITAGDKRYQLFISSDTQKNAKVIVRYQP
jgi:hypothetical protein